MRRCQQGNPSYLLYPVYTQATSINDKFLQKVEPPPPHIKLAVNSTVCTVQYTQSQPTNPKQLLFILLAQGQAIVSHVSRGNFNDAN